MNKTLVEGGVAEGSVFLSDMMIPEGTAQTLVQIAIGIITVIRFLKERRAAKKDAKR